MRFGIFTMNAHSCSRPETAIAVAQAAEEAGFDSLWCGEHVVMTEPPVGREPLAPRDPILDPLIALAHLAGVTSKVRLATGVMILPLRNPLVLAKQLSSLDVLSNGRLIFGFGVGWLEPEFDALGVPFRDRGARADEYLDAMINLWTCEEPEFQGVFSRFSSVQCRPQPVQRPYPHIVVGGRSKPAMERAARSGHGWFGGLLFDAGTLVSDLRELQECCESVGRPSELGRLEVTASVKGHLDRRRVDELADLGVDRLMLIPHPGVHDGELAAWVERTGRELEVLGG